MNNIHEEYMHLAIDEAKIAQENGDWPFGAVIVRKNSVVGKGFVKDKSGGDVTEHAEIVAIRNACRNLQSNDMSDATIYCTNEPCLMCASTIFQAKIKRIVIGASRDDLPHLLRTRKFRIEDIASDAGYDIEIIRGILKNEVLGLFEGVINK